MNARGDLEAAARVRWSVEHVKHWEPHEWRTADATPPLLIGHDLTQLGLTPGPQFKVLLDAMRDAQLDGVIHSTKQVHELVERLLGEG